MSSAINRDTLPKHFPTNGHDPMFWEKLGRAVATFGFLEMILARAIFALTVTASYPEDKVEDAFTEWCDKMKRTFSDTLGKLILDFEKAAEEHPDVSTENLEELTGNLKKGSKIRNVLCHAAWPHPPDSTGASTPFYIDRGLGKFDSPVDLTFLENAQKLANQLMCDVMDTVTRTGYQFPGSSGPGKPIIPERGNAPASAVNEQGDLAASDGQESKSPK